MLIRVTTSMPHLQFPSRFSRNCSPSFFYKDTATTEIYTLSLHDALPIFAVPRRARHLDEGGLRHVAGPVRRRSEEHTSELQSRGHLVCRLLLEKKITP